MSVLDDFNRDGTFCAKGSELKENGFHLPPETKHIIFVPRPKDHGCFVGNVKQRQLDFVHQARNVQRAPGPRGHDMKDA